MKSFSAIIVVAVVLATLRLHADTHYVNAACATPLYPYTDWEHAAITIQDAVDVTAVGDVVLVTNGVYSSGGAVTPGFTLSNRVVAVEDV